MRAPTESKQADFRQKLRKVHTIRRVPPESALGGLAVEKENVRRGDGSRASSKQTTADCGCTFPKGSGLCEREIRPLNLSQNTFQRCKIREKSPCPPKSASIEMVQPRSRCRNGTLIVKFTREITRYLTCECPASPTKRGPPLPPTSCGDKRGPPLQPTSCSCRKGNMRASGALGEKRDVDPKSQLHEQNARQTSLGVESSRVPKELFSQRPKVLGKGS